MELCSINACTGCGLCYAVCNRKAIHFKNDALGFRFPIIDSDKCIECGLCRKKCPAINPVNRERMNDCYLAWAKDDTIHYESSSGGMAYILQRYVLKNGGYIIGCIWDDDFNAVLTVIDDLEKLQKTIGSKYVQSYIADSAWSEIKERNKAGQKGVVIGLPCQVAALKAFVNAGTNILFIDLLCRGGCSPACLKTHLLHLRKKKRFPKITDIRFRGGDNDCSITLWNGSEIVYKGAQFRDAYFYSFMKHGLLHESCYHCQYANSNRVSDITLADFWGIDSEFIKDKHQLNGTNLVLIHSEKGMAAWNNVKDEIEYYQRTLEEAINGNDTLREATPPPSDRSELLALIERKGFEKAVRYDPIYRHNNSQLRLLKAKVYGIIVMTMKKLYQKRLIISLRI